MDEGVPDSRKVRHAAIAGGAEAFLADALFRLEQQEGHHRRQQSCENYDGYQFSQTDARHTFRPWRGEFLRGILCPLRKEVNKNRRSFVFVTCGGIRG
ncbi:MAG: hypothetical protein DRH15_12685 [Deltaproteobacteria bacterium]|nr:MAG: hypothetical protein DRH15_12685 [Deltaproteobacteria bacterium]